MTDNNVARCKKCYLVALEPDGYEHILYHQSEDKKERAFRARILKLEETIAQFSDRINTAERTVAATQADNDRMRAELDAAEAADMAAPLNVSDLDIPEPEPDEEFNDTPTTEPAEVISAEHIAIAYNDTTEPDYPPAIDRDDPVPRPPSAYAVDMFGNRLT